MITLKTITTIELSSLCNLKCKYCINRLLVKDDRRRPGIMSDEVFFKALFWLETLCRRGSQREVNLNGNGESTLDPQLPERVWRVKEVMGERPVALCTNGLNMDEELAACLKDVGLDRIDVSPHSAYHARKAVYMLHDAGLNGILATGQITASHNWAGQLEKAHRIDCRLHNRCDPLIEGRGYVLSEGNVTPCCYDYRNLGVFGSVFDNDLLAREIRPYALCEACHQQIPIEEAGRAESSKLKGFLKQ